jgi:serine protease Do
VKTTYQRLWTGRGVAAMLLAAVSLSLVASASAQLSSRDAPRSSPKIMAVFREVVAKPSESTVRIQCDGKDCALGTVVGADGWILTKFSELKGKPICKMRDGKDLEAEIVGVHDTTDLALLKVDARDLKVVDWADSKEAPVGNWVASAGPGSEPVAIGVVSVGARKTSTRRPTFTPSPGSGFLGVAMDEAPAGVKITLVGPGSAAEKAGLKVDDIVLAVNGSAVKDPDSMAGLVGKHKPDEKVTLKIKRGDQEMEIVATLGKRPPQSRGDFQNRLGSELSERRSGFPMILQHDTVIKPTDCGGPLVDLDGRVVGINIARAGRTESYAIPSEFVQPLLTDLKSGKLKPTAAKQE